MELDLKEYGFTESIISDYTQGLPARIIAVHKERYALVSPLRYNKS